MMETDNVVDTEVEELPTLYCGKALMEMTVEDFNINMSIVEIDSQDSIYNAIRLLSLHHITAVPVWSSESHQYLGYVEIKDVINLLCDIALTSKVFASLKSLLVHLGKTRSESLKLTAIAAKHPFHAVHEGASIMDVIEVLKSGVSRVPVVSKSTGKILQMVSQTDVIYHLAKHVNELDASKVSASLQEVNIMNKDIVCISSNDTAFAAVSLMKEHNLSAIPVIDETDKEYLSTTISESDIIMAAAWFLDDEAVVEWTNVVGLCNFFSQSVLSFIHTVRTSPIGRRPRSTRLFPTAVTVNPKDRICNIIGKLASSGYHRLYVIDLANSNKLVGVVSLVDIIQLLF